MKRRQFLATSAGFAGSLLPLISRGAGCPPGLLQATGGTSAITTCPSVAPSWFVSLPELSWVPIAGGSSYGSSYQNGATIRTVSPSTSAYPNGQGAEGVSAVMNDWTGGCCYQAGGQYLIPAQGGHNGYYCNEVYSLALRQEVPGWQRIWGPTPNAQISTSEIAYNEPYTGYADGAPRTSHGWFSTLCTSGGRVLITFVDACPSGRWTTECYSLDINNPGAGWTFHGRLWATLPGSAGSEFLYQSGPGIYDPVGDRFYRAAEGAVGSPANGVVGVNVATMLAAGQQPTTGPQTPGSTLYNLSYGTALSDGWSVVLDDMSPRCWVIASIDNSRLWILNLENPSAGFTQKTTTGSPTGFQAGLGAVYHKPSRAILVGGKELGRNIRKLQITGTNPLTATYAWSNVALGGVTPASESQFNGTYSKWQMVEDMGNGQSGIVMATQVGGPTYFVKLPSSGV